MAEEIAIENGLISKFEKLVTLTLTSDRVRLHTVVHHLSTSTYVPNFIEIELFVDRQTDGHETGFVWSTLSKSRLNNTIMHTISMTKICQCYKLPVNKVNFLRS